MCNESTASLFAGHIERYDMRIAVKAQCPQRCSRVLAAAPSWSDTGPVLRVKVDQNARSAALLRALRDESRVRIGLTEGQKRALGLSTVPARDAATAAADTCTAKSDPDDGRTRR
jgi:hypothetical protein